MRYKEWGVDYDIFSIAWLLRVVQESDDLFFYL